MLSEAFMGKKMSLRRPRHAENHQEPPQYQQKVKLFIRSTCVYGNWVYRDNAAQRLLHDVLYVRGLHQRTKSRRTRSNARQSASQAPPREPQTKGTEAARRDDGVAVGHAHFLYDTVPRTATIHSIQAIMNHVHFRTKREPRNSPRFRW